MSAALLVGACAKRSEPGSTASLIRMGDDLREAGDLDGAAGFYLNASRKDPADPTPFLRMGDLRRAAGNPAQAEAAYRTALQARPGDRAAAAGLASSLLAQGRGTEALVLIEPAARGSDDVALLVNYGVALDMAGRQADAQAVYRRGIAKVPGNAGLHANLALSLAVSGDTEAALASMRMAEALGGGQTWPTANSVLLLAYAGREAEARQRGEGSLADGETEALLARGRQARAASTPGERAAALGVVGAGPSLPAAEAPTASSPERSQPQERRSRRQEPARREQRDRPAQQARP